ncbi:MAG: efflux RND transporter periplasmic adaptor subunit [Legionellaceae bacterium]|nr:efflux RND transporter periplasmic adaptor subunit [Legionellaceae bacterium]
MYKQIKAHYQTVVKRPFFIACYLFLFLVLGILFSRHLAALSLDKQTNRNAIANVTVISAKATSKHEKIYLPGSALAWHEAPVFARTKGYLKEWYVDIGYRVKKGDLLAVIARPELDAQYEEAKAYLKMIIAQNDLAQITAKRWNNLVRTDSVSKQANDNKTYEAASLAAELVKARANLEYLTALVSFEKVIAPFDGTISLRQTDIGALINIGSNPAEAQPLFRIVQLDRLRLYVNIPQTYSSRITPDMQVTMRFAEHPGKTFPAKLIKTADAINPVTLTLQAEFEVQNQEEVLMPGSYTMVEFTITSYPNSVILPINTLIFRAEGLQVAVVNKDNRIDLRNITMGTDFGSEVQINSGILPGERIVINPYDYIHQGEYVHVIA